MPDSKEQRLVKHAAAVTIASTLTLTQRKVWNVLLYHAYPYLLARDVHAIPATGLYAVSDTKTENVAWLRRAFLDLMDLKLEWGILGGNHRWEGYVALAYASIERGTCEYAYPPTMARALQAPEFYARLDLDVQRRFSHAASLVMWEYFHLILGANQDANATLPLAELRRMFGYGPRDYPQFKIFRRDVLAPALDDLNDNGDLTAVMELIRTGRQVGLLKFTLHRRNPDDPLVDRMRDEFGLSDKAVQLALSRYQDRGRLLQLLGYIQERYNHGEIKNLGAYTFTVLRDAIVNPPPEPALQLAGKNQSVPSVADRVLERDRLKQEYEAHCVDAAERVYFSLPEAQRAELDATYLPGFLRDPHFRRFHERDGLSHPMCRAAFLGRLAHVILGDAMPAFESWLRDRP